MKQNDAELNVWIDEFAKQGYVTINRGNTYHGYLMLVFYRLTHDVPYLLFD